MLLTSTILDRPVPLGTSQPPDQSAFLIPHGQNARQNQSQLVLQRKMKALVGAMVNCIANILRLNCTGDMRGAERSRAEHSDRLT